MVEYDILIKNGLVVTMDSKRRVFERGFVAIVGDKIVEVGKDPSGKSAEKVIDAKGAIVMPGIICGHTHLYGILLRGSPWFAKIEPPTDFIQNLHRIWWAMDEIMNYDDAYASALAASFEMMKSGVTLFADTFSGPNAIEGVLDRIKEAVERVGIRGIIAFEATERHSREEGERGIRENIRFIEKVRREKDPLVTGMISIHASFTVTNWLLKWARELANQYRVPITLHTSEGLIDPYHNLERYGMRTIERLYKVGLLGPDVVAVHAVHVIDDELELIAKTGTKIAHNPLSNMLNAVGAPPIHKMLKMGITVTIGNDGYIFDPFENIRGAYLLAKAAFRDPRLITPLEAIEMATINGAKAYGLEDKLGSLEPGKKADVVIIKPELMPTPLNAETVYGHLVNTIDGDDVDTVIVNGRIVMEHRKSLTISEEEVNKVSQETTAKFWERLLTQGKYQLDIVRLE
ncbi:MAG: amidohydrolase [Thermoprotei archaeon]|nr:MAG: amidohydrolase [Thermoprotei archaeon]